MTALKVAPVDGTVVAYLKPLLTGVTVATQTPPTVPAKFAHVVLAGGGGRRDLVLHDATVAVEAWADTYALAADLMATIDAHMNNARFASTVIRDVQSFGAPVSLPLPDSPKFRLTATYQVTVRASAL